MADITMCSGDGCPVKQFCFRHTARPNQYAQSFFVVSPRKGDTCEYYWYNKKKTHGPKEEQPPEGQTADPV